MKNGGPNGTSLELTAMLRRLVRFKNFNSTLIGIGAQLIGNHSKFTDKDILVNQTLAHNAQGNNRKRLRFKFFRIITDHFL